MGQDQPQGQQGVEHQVNAARYGREQGSQSGGEKRHNQRRSPSGDEPSREDIELVPLGPLNVRYDPEGRDPHSRIEPHSDTLSSKTSPRFRPSPTHFAEDACLADPRTMRTFKARAPLCWTA